MKEFSRDGDDIALLEGRNILFGTVLLKVWSLDQQQGINRKFWGMHIPRFPHQDLLNQKLDGPSSPQVMLNLVQ